MGTKILLGLILLGIFIVSGCFQVKPIVIDKCPYTITSSGNYILENDVIHSNPENNDTLQACVEAFGASRFTLDCQGNSIIGQGPNVDSGSGLGIYVQNSNGITIKNCEVTKFGQGITLDSTDNSLLDNNVVRVTSTGITLWMGSDNNRLTNNKVLFNDDGVDIMESTRNILTGNVADSNRINGIFLGDRSGGNSFDNNTVTNTQGSESSTDFFCNEGIPQNIDSGGNVCSTQAQCESWLRSCP